MRNLLVALTFISSPFQELKVPNLPNYFGISGQKYDHYGEERISLYPVVKDYSEDSIGQFINQYSRRFEYLILPSVCMCALD